MSKHDWNMISDGVAAIWIYRICSGGGVLAVSHFIVFAVLLDY